MKKLLLYFLSIILFATACDTVELEEVDPNNFVDATPDLLIKAPMLAQALVIEGELARIGNIFSNQFTGADRQYVSYNSYNVTASDFDNIWGNIYADGIVQCRIIKEKCIPINNDLLYGIAEIVEANILGTAASLFGNVPDTEAGDDVTYPQPAFDAQADVYAHAIALLTDAISKVGSNTVTGAGYAVETIDASVRGNMTWSEVAYSIQARLYLHLISQ